MNHRQIITDLFDKIDKMIIEELEQVITARNDSPPSAISNNVAVAVAHATARLKQLKGSDF